MSSSTPPSPALVERALALIAAAETESPAKSGALRDELAAWRAGSAEHASAYNHALRQWETLGMVAKDLRACFAEPERARKRRVPGARGTLTVLACVTALAGLIAWYLGQPLFEQSARTGVAQIALIALPDASRIDVNAQSSLQATFYRDRRMVRMTHGEARFEVAADPERPFRVVLRNAVVEVVGTIFVVTDRGEAVNVEVERGRVRLRSSASGEPVELSGGERVTLRGGMPGPVEKLGSRELASWRDGWLVFDNERMADALPAINAFRTAPLVAADERVAALRLTARFLAADSQSLLSALPRILPVTIANRPDGSAEIRMR